METNSMKKNLSEIDYNNENSQNNANHKTFENNVVTEDVEDISDNAFQIRHAKAEIYERLNKKSDKKCDRYVYRFIL